MSDRLRAITRALSLVLIAWLNGCAILPGSVPGAVSTSSPFDARALARQTFSTPQANQCLQWFDRVDAHIGNAKLTDAMHSKLTSFPFLRVNRFLASYSNQALNEEQTGFWLEQLLELDHSSRRLEFRKLTQEQHRLLSEGSTEGLEQTLNRCGRLLTGLVRQNEASLAIVRAQAVVPDDYSISLRALGVYPLVRWPFLFGVWRWQQSSLDRFRHDSVSQDLSASTQLTPARRLYAPAFARPSAPSAAPAPPALLPEPADRSQAAAILERASANPLRIPMPTRVELDWLARAHAPMLLIDTAGPADWPGTPAWTSEPQARVTVNTERPVLTVRAGHTRVADRVLLQLTFTAWFSERPKRGWIDLLAGSIDGLTWRVTLAPDGQAWLYDSIHPCGCYHQFFPGPHALARREALASWTEESLFIPQAFTESLRGKRALISLTADSHYIQGVRLIDAEKDPGIADNRTRPGGDPPTQLQLLDEDELRAMPVNGHTRSWFGPDGLIAGTERAERWLFWPMGIKSAGAMRQAGRQATAFVGRRHFDDADLLDHYFQWVGPASD